MDILTNNDGCFLYKYLPYNHYSLQILINKELWLGPPDMLNDPFEGEFIIKNYKNFQNDSFIEALLKAQWANSIYYEILYSENHTLFKSDDKAFLNCLYEYLNACIRRKFGTTSFSKKYDKMSMWSHYADSHKGFVIVFDREKLERKIDYDTKLVDVSYNGFPEIEIDFFEDKITYGGKKLLTSKLPEWLEEEETRFIRENDFESIIPRFLSFEKDCILGIILGSRLAYENAKTLIQIKRSSFNDIVMITSNKNKARNSLEFEPLKI